MISIKKVSVTPLPENTTGEIIDSFDTTDDKHTNAPSINASKNYIDSKASTAQSNAVNTARTYTDNKVSAKQNTVLSGTSAPSNSLGVNGDIYLQYTS